MGRRISDPNDEGYTINGFWSIERSASVPPGLGAQYAIVETLQ
jgi:hypothetical protein